MVKIFFDDWKELEAKPDIRLNILCEPFKTSSVF